MTLTDIKSRKPEDLRREFEAMAFPGYRADQLFQWLHQKHVQHFEEMTNLPKALRAQLAAVYRIPKVEIAGRYPSNLDETVKYLFRMEDGALAEGVLMRYRHGDSICISTQLGCKMGCDFCATGKTGFSRNLLASELLGQIQQVHRETGRRISNVVLMGMGEPLDNYQEVLRFLSLVSHEKGLGIGMRHISLSTCGIVDKIYDLADRGFQLTLSVSLHASNDEIRRRIMPVARKWDLKQLLKACRYYSDKTKRRISFEYAMIRGVNDGLACARELGGRLRGILAHINLIPMNQIEETAYEQSPRQQIRQFAGVLEGMGFSVTVRRTLGSDIDASCGQLRRREKEVQIHES